MPSKTKKQHNFMAAVANNPAFAKRVGVSKSVGEEFLKADKGKRFGTGGSTGVTYGGQNQINKQRTRFGSKYGYKLNVPNESINKYVGKKEGGLMKEVDAEKNPGLAKLPTEVRNKMGYMKKGGMAHSDVAKDKPMMKKVAKEEVKMHEKKMHGKKMASGGKVGQLSKADGCAIKGKSKGKMISMKSGGYC